MVALEFSKVTIEADGESVNFLISGNPCHGIELYGWAAYEEFIKAHPNVNEARIQPYSYGEGQLVTASPEEVAYMNMRRQSNPEFLETRCSAGAPKTIKLKGGGGLCSLFSDEELEELRQLYRR